MKRRWFAALLALIMALSLMPAAALAAEEKPQTATAVEAVTENMGRGTEDSKPAPLPMKYQIIWYDKGYDNWPTWVAAAAYNVEFDCVACADDLNHEGYHTISISEFTKKGIPTVWQATAERQSSSLGELKNNCVFIGWTTTNDPSPEIRSFDEEGTIELPKKSDGWRTIYLIVEKVNFNAAKWLDVKCKTNAHETVSYKLDEDTYTIGTAQKNADGNYTCRLTIDKAPYIEKYNKAHTDCTHADIAPEANTVTLDLTYQDGKWIADKNAEISVKCAPDQVSFDLDDIGGGVHAINKTLTGNYPEKFAESFRVTVTPDKENPAPSMSAESLTGTASVSADIGYQEVPFRFAGPAVEQSTAEVPAAGQLTFHKEGTYRYSVQEMKGGSACTSYDETAYTLSIEVVREGNALTVADWRFDGADECTPLTITNSYRDIPYIPTPTPAPQPAKPALNTADHYAYLMGYPDGTVRPGGSITRAEATTIFFRLLTEESRSQFWATENRYSDVSAGRWYNNAVSTMTRAGIVNGYPDGTFRPNAPITRAEMAKIIALFAKLEPSAERFPDTAGHWAEPYIRLAAGSGWIEGYPDGTFRPDRAITRAETVTMIDRVLERVPKDESRLLPHETMLTFPDCRPGQWFYIAVQEAANSHIYERAASEQHGDEHWKELRDNRDWTRLEH